jgi:hypothetical protein
MRETRRRLTPRLQFPCDCSSCSCHSPESMLAQQQDLPSQTAIPKSLLVCAHMGDRERERECVCVCVCVAILHRSSPLERMVPGATALTRTPLDDHSGCNRHVGVSALQTCTQAIVGVGVMYDNKPTARVLVKLSTPARAAPVCAINGKPFHMLAMTFTMTPMIDRSTT